MIKTIKGHRYRYQQRTWREGRHVRCENVYLGRADAPLYRPLATNNGDVTPLIGSVEKKTKPSENKLVYAPKTMRPLVLANEDTFIADLFNETAHAGKDWQSGYNWRKRNGEGLSGLDEEVLQLPLRLGVTVRSQIQKGKSGFPCFMERGLKSWSLPNMERKVGGSRYRGAVISLPDPSKWVGVAGASPERCYMATLLHEVVHATREKLGRPNSHWEPHHGMRTRLYAREELVAELSANLVARRLGLERETMDMSRAYLVGWKRRLPKDVQADDVAWAIAEAKRAADFVVAHHSRGGFGVNTTSERNITLVRPKSEDATGGIWKPVRALQGAVADKSAGEEMQEASVDSLRLFHGRSGLDVLRERGRLEPGVVGELEQLQSAGESQGADERARVLAEEVLRQDGYAGVHWVSEGESGDVYKIWDESCVEVRATVRVDGQGHKTGVLH